MSQPPACPVGIRATSSLSVQDSLLCDRWKSCANRSLVAKIHASCIIGCLATLTPCGKGRVGLGVWDARLRSAQRSSLGVGAVRRIRTAPIHQQNDLRAKPPRPNGPGNGRLGTDQTPARLYAGCCSPCRDASLLQQESTEEAGQRQRNSDHAPANHVLKSAEALNAGCGSCLF